MYAALRQPQEVWSYPQRRVRPTTLVVETLKQKFHLKFD